MFNEDPFLFYCKNHMDPGKGLEIPSVALAGRKRSSVLEPRGKYQKVIGDGHVNSSNLSFLTLRARRGPLSSLRFLPGSFPDTEENGSGSSGEGEGGCQDSSPFVAAH